MTKRATIEGKLKTMNELLMLMVKKPASSSHNDTVMKEHDQNQTIVSFMREMACIRDRFLCRGDAEEVDSEIEVLEGRALDFLSKTLGIAVPPSQDNSKKSLIKEGLLST